MKVYVWVCDVGVECRKKESEKWRDYCLLLTSKQSVFGGGGGGGIICSTPVSALFLLCSINKREWD